jgi:hypothetical protein
VAVVKVGDRVSIRPLIRGATRTGTVERFSPNKEYALIYLDGRDEAGWFRVERLDARQAELPNETKENE